MRISAAVIDRLVANGIDTVFGIPGKQTLPLNQSIDESEEIEFVVARHETAVTHQAWGYAETSGDVAATFVVPGPGDMNAMNGLKNALNDCTPLVHFAVETEPEIRGGDGIHETPPGTYDNVVKENILVERPSATASEVDRAIAIAQTPPKGPVRIGIPKNFLKMDVSLSQARDFDTDCLESVADGDVDAAAELLADADAPLILAGGGVRSAEASDELCSLAEALGAPVVTSYKGKGVIPEDHPLAAGTLSGSATQELLAAIGKADAALGVGTDFDAVATRSWSVNVPDRLVHVTLHPDDLGTGYDPAVAVIGDAAEAMQKIEDRLADEHEPADGEVTADRLLSARDGRIEPLLGDEQLLTSVQVLRTARETIPREATVAVDAGGFRVWGLNTFEAYGPRKYVNPGSWATMGTGLPSGIGAQLANPDEDVVVLTGDGGLMMCVHELHTAVAADLPITILVINNNDYAIITEEAERTYDLDTGVYGWEESPISFTALAESMGMTTRRAETDAELANELAVAVAADEPVLVEVPTDPHEPQASEWMSE
ncbi:thiamine pyrophosphate-binding protein [Natrinema gelatinilyticum]|uniref:thiamine pyrophosphate-binding protein n=1 Tax=Natrinema gelatinilyticum TaxID=2961571 RepID=UPI0020C1D4DF|nr:thiamine pyrophosphate-binding protein [Natrinema gelatinilyticum]